MHGYHLSVWDVAFIQIIVWYAAGVDPYDKNAQAPSELVSFTSSFHGRTLGALVLTYKVQNLHCLQK